MTPEQLHHELLDKYGTVESFFENLGHGRWSYLDALWLKWSACWVPFTSIYHFSIFPSRPLWLTIKGSVDHTWREMAVIWDSSFKTYYPSFECFLASQPVFPWALKSNHPWLQPKQIHFCGLQSHYITLLSHMTMPQRGKTYYITTTFATTTAEAWLWICRNSIPKPVDSSAPGSAVLSPSAAVAPSRVLHRRVVASKWNPKGFSAFKAFQTWVFGEI